MKTSKTKSILLLAAFLFSGLMASAQNGIKFEKMSFAKAQEVAQKEGKIIFVDVQRGGGNKGEIFEKVEKEVFTIDSIADFFNNNCVNIIMDMSSEEGKAFAPNLNMLMYPAYVFYAAKGDPLQNTHVGAVSKDPGVLMQKARASAAVADVKSQNTRKVTFEKGSWAEVVKKAKKEGKLIFFDAQTEWCRPCRMMGRDVFNLDHIADFYNGNFVNVTLDMEKGEGPELRKKYGVRAYPTYLFIDPVTEKVVFEDGGYKEADVFLKVGKDALTKKGKKK